MVERQECGNGSLQVSVLVAGNASGMASPPFFIFPGKEEQLIPHLLSKGKEVCPQACGTISERGALNRKIFTSWLKDHFLKYLPSQPTKEEPVLLIFDGHMKYLNFSTMAWAAENHLHIVFLQAHTSHLCQPLDIGCFSPHEKKLKEELHEMCIKLHKNVINFYSLPISICIWFRFLKCCKRALTIFIVQG